MTKQEYVDLKQFKTIKKIGNGGFGFVYLIKDTQTNTKYAAKTTKQSINEYDQDSDEAVSLFREVRIMSALNHPAVIRFCGFSPIDFYGEDHPTIITEYLPNGDLQKILDLESEGKAPEFWNDTKKLICIYGIASGMSYLHKNGIIHRDLKPENVLMDENNNPKITDLGFAKFHDDLSGSFVMRSENQGEKGTAAYMAPEVFYENLCSEKSDVYSFAIIVCQIFTKRRPYQNTKWNHFSLISNVVSGARPAITDDVPDAFAELIRECWLSSPENRLTFDEILEALRLDESYVTDNVNKEEFMEYVKSIDNYQSDFNISNKNIHFKTFLSHENITKISSQNDIEIPVPEKIVYPTEEFDKLDDECQQLAKDAEDDPQKQFLVGKYLIKGEKFPQNTQLGIKYLRQSCKNDCNKAILYLSKLYIDGKLIPKDIDEAQEILSKFKDKEDGDYLLLIGRVEKKKQNFENSFKSLKKAASLGNAEAMYRLGKEFLKGEGTEVDEKKANEYFELAHKNGYIKAKQTQYNLQLSKGTLSTNTQVKFPLRDISIQSQKINRCSNNIILQMNDGMIKDQSSSIPINLNMLLIGDKDCGKHQLTYYLFSGLFPESIPTSFDNESFQVNFYGEKFIINLFENYGNENNKSVRQMFYQITNIFVMVYSLIDKSSLNSLTNMWNEDIMEYKNNAYVALIGVDLEKWSADPNNANYVTNEEIKNAQTIIKPSISTKCSYVTGENVKDFKNKFVGSYVMNFYNHNDYL